MDQALKEKINASPLKKNYMARKIGINASVLSMCIKGDRVLDADKEQKLKNLLNSVLN